MNLGVVIILVYPADGGARPLDRTQGVALRRADAGLALELTEAAVAVEPAARVLSATHT